MSAKKQYEKLKALSERPPAELSDWLAAAEDGVNFLISNADADAVVIYAAMPDVLIHGVLAKAELVVAEHRHDLEHDWIDPGSTWCIEHVYRGDGPSEVSLAEPLSEGALEGAEKLVFQRSFEGMSDYRPPLEMSQKLIHTLGAHFLESHNAYCRLNSEGDIEEVISIIRARDDDPQKRSVAVLISAEHLAKYLALTSTILVRRFDFTRCAPGFQSWSDTDRWSVDEPAYAYHGGRSSGGSYVNGFHLTRASLTVDDLREDWSGGAKSKSYESFLIHDWKNKRLVECNAGPDHIVNYFTKSDKPYEMSPAFFRPEVLAKYKADTDKYDLKTRSISCRNAWHLKTYDVNEEGQVHTYIGYLADLPHSEQQHWKLYNEPPKGGLSMRAIETDFEGSWSSEPDPLSELTCGADDLNRQKPSWWTVRSSTAMPKVLSPVTGAAKEWADEILALDQLLVEGLSTKGLRKIAEAGGVAMKPEWQSMALLEAALQAKGFDADTAKETVSPLRELHHLRSKVRGHATDERKALETAALRDFGSYRNHFHDLALRCSTAFKLIRKTLG